MKTLIQQALDILDIYISKNCEQMVDTTSNIIELTHEDQQLKYTRVDIAKPNSASKIYTRQFPKRDLTNEKKQSNDQSQTIGQHKQTNRTKKQTNTQIREKE